MSHLYSSESVVPTISDIAKKNVTVMGLGLNGGGEATVRFLLNNGANVIVTDMKTESQLKPTIDSLKQEFPNCDRLHFVLGEHRLSDFKNADFVIKNPGVKFENNKFLAEAKNIETDLSLFLRYTTAPIIAVTGSKGKSSTVSAIHYGLSKAGFSTFLGGNITVSPLTFLDKTNEKTPVVLELSSWQLADLRGRKLLCPKIALITKIVPDHQNWYGNMESYVADKKVIYLDQCENDYTICEENDYWGNIFASETKATVIRYGKDNDLINDLIVPGKHMRQNVANAAIVMNLMGIPKDKIQSIMATYPGIEHRLEFFHEYKSEKALFRFYNDTTATVPEATIAAVDAFDKDVILITGGTDKGLSFLDLDEFLSKTIETKKLIGLYFLKGSGTDKLLESLKPINFFENKTIHFIPYESLTDLLTSLKNDIDENSYKDISSAVVVFSPGATSFGMFNNEFHRGNSFKTEVLKLF